MILKGRFGFGAAEGEAWLLGTGPRIKARVRWDAPEQALKNAVARLEKQLETEKARLSRGKEYLDFPLAILRDPELWSGLMSRLKKGTDLRLAVQETFQRWEKKFRKLGDPYLRLRAHDLADLKRRLLLLLEGDGKAEFPHKPFVAVAKDLFVTDLLELYRYPVKGICLEEGNETAHGVLLAKALGIPLAGGLGGLLKQVKKGDWISVDGPDVYVNETASHEISHVQVKHTDRFVTRDGHEVTVRANLQLPEEIAAAQAVGAQGVGLFRTEFLWLSRPLSLKEEVEVYRSAIEVFKPFPVVFRLVDFGSDKPYPKLRWPEEKNPALGLRGLRLLLDRPTLLRRQLEALLRAAGKETLHLLLPMVRTSAEIREFLDEMSPIQRKHGCRVKLGIMVETPSSALMAGSLPREISFMSLGTNDLLQYFFAVDRINPQIEVDALDPLFVRFLHGVIREADKRGKSVSLCGELAGDPGSLPVLLGLGLRELSVSIPKIPVVAEALKEVSLRDAQKRIERMLSGP